MSKSTVHKVVLSISDIDRHYYATHQLTLARHPSETEERMMMRLLAFMRHASESLRFGPGLSTEDEPALCERDETGLIRCWIDVGLPDERILRRACGRAERVVLLCYGGNIVDVWWQKNASKLSALDRLSVWNVSPEVSSGLRSLVDRSMSLQCTIQDGHFWVSNDLVTHAFSLHCLQRDIE